MPVILLFMGANIQIKYEIALIECIFNVNCTLLSAICEYI